MWEIPFNLPNYLNSIEEKQSNHQINEFISYRITYSILNDYLFMLIKHSYYPKERRQLVLWICILPTTSLLPFKCILLTEFRNLCCLFKWLNMSYSRFNFHKHAYPFKRSVYPIILKIFGYFLLNFLFITLWSFLNFMIHLFYYSRADHLNFIS